MTPDPANAGREQDGRFSPGCSGNPAGKAGRGEVTPGEAEKLARLPGEDQPTSLGQAALQPSLKAAATIQSWTCDLDIADLSNELSNQARAVNAGDLKRA